VGDKVDISLIMNGIRSHWCAKIIAFKIEQGSKRYRVQTLAKIPPKWVSAFKIQHCTHHPQVASPHNSVVAALCSVGEDGHGVGSHVMGH